jgi:general secretion pathway protein K
MTPKEGKTQQSGFVLVVVLCMVIMLAGMLFGFNAKSRMTLCTIDNFEKSQKALNCARAGLNIAIAAIIEANSAHTSKTLPGFDSKESVFDVAGGTCSLTIVEESGKFNVNLLRNENGDLNRTRIDQLLRLIDLLNRENFSHSYISYSVIPAIIDWTDDDDQVTYLPFIKHENSGAESSYYRYLNPPYMCKNRPFDTTEELLFVKGVTMEVLNQMRDYVTVYGDGKININYAPKCVIESLSEKMDAALAQMIIDRRQLKLFDSATELREVPGMTDEVYYTIKKTITVDRANPYYYVTSNGKVGQLASTIIAVLRENMETKSIEVVLYKEY